MEKRTKVDFCGDILYLTDKEIERYKENVEMLLQLSEKAKYPKDRAEKEFYLKILKEE